MRSGRVGKCSIETSAVPEGSRSSSSGSGHRSTTTMSCSKASPCEVMRTEGPIAV